MCQVVASLIVVGAYRLKANYFHDARRAEPVIDSGQSFAAARGGPRSARSRGRVYAHDLAQKKPEILSSLGQSWRNAPKGLLPKPSLRCRLLAHRVS